MLVVHRSERADSLVAALGEVVRQPPDDPIRPEVVAVPTRGVERWLTQRLSHTLGAGATGGDGVCANLAFPFPATVLGQVVAAATGIDPEQDPWRPERCVWPLIELIDEHRGDPALAALVDHLEAATPVDAAGRPGPLRRLSMARHIADLYDRYSVHRPQLVLSWLAGPAPGAGAAGSWQAHMWRLLRGRIGVPSPAERLASVVDTVRDHPGVVDLPSRLSVFGLTRLPASHLEVLAALGEGRDVHLFLLHPSAALWDRIGSGLLPPTVTSRAQDPTARLASHPLLRSWARDAREMQLVLAAHRMTGGPHHPVPPRAGRPGGVLQALQADIRADRAPGRSGRQPIGAKDRSLQVHSCHGRTRQVEVVRHAVLHLLRDDPTLEPRDVIIMCPDIEAFAPLIHAAFGVGPDPGRPIDTGGEGAQAGPQVRVRLADRSLRQTNPLLAVAAQLMDLAGSRLSAPAVMDLISRPPVSRRFGFDPDELSTVERWVAGAGIRWGIDAAGRRPWSLDRVAGNTWSAGIDRLMLGAAMSDDGCRMFGGTVPFDDVPSPALDLAGRVAEMVDRLGRAVDRLGRSQGLGAWISELAAATESLARAAPGDEWQHEQLLRILAEAAGSRPADAGAGPGPDLTPEEIRSLLADRLQGRPTRANFRTGDLTICTLVPMRSVPHRVVALLGLDDGSFPRHAELDGDDLLIESPQVGDRDPRSEDRQLLLDALLAAEDHLIITYSGRDERTNRPRPPCPPVAELLDVVDATFDGPGDGRARDRVVVAHPLQAFDPINFRPGALGVDGPWSFDPVALAGARAAADQAAGPPWLPEPLPALDEPVVQLDQLIGFVQHPVRSFLRRRLNLYLSDRDEDLQDALPLELDPLQRWAVGDRLLESVLAGVDLEQAVAAERLRGFLPPGEIAAPVLADICSDVEDLHRACLDLGMTPAGTASLEVRVETPDGRAVVGTVPGVRGSTICQCHYSRLGPKHRLAAWVRFLALTADRPEAGIAAVTVGRGTRRSSVAVARLQAPDMPAAGRRAWALERLQVLIDLQDRGMRAPLPLACRSGAAWVQGRRRGESDDQLQTRVGYEWLSSDRFPGEQDDAEHVEVWGAHAPASVLLGSHPSPDERGPGWAAGERSRFAVLARRLWDPLLDHESLVDR